MADILVINGPNLNLLGQREPDKYGKETLNTIETRLANTAESHGLALENYQSNHEGQLVERIHQGAAEKVHCIIINAAAYTHTSIALRDALLATALPFFEVHLSNIYARESFRQYSYLADIARGTICGLGSTGYDLALSAAIAYCHDQL